MSVARKHRMKRRAKGHSDLLRELIMLNRPRMSLKEACEDLMIELMSLMHGKTYFMSVAEKRRMEGREEGKAEVLRELSMLIKSVVTDDEALQIVSDKTKELMSQNKTYNSL